jgi:hypothetical protein
MLTLLPVLQRPTKCPVSVQDGQDEDALWLDEIDEAIGADDQLSKAG